MSTSAGTRPDPGILARTFEDDQHSWTRALALRRRLVVVEAGLFTALVVVTLVAASTSDGWDTGFLIAWCTGMLAFLPVHSVLNSGIRGVFDRRLRTLDEHQRLLRFESVARTGPASGALTFAAWAGSTAVVALTGHTALALGLGFLLWMAAGLLPYWRLAWTMPEEDRSAP